MGIWIKPSLLKQYHLYHRALDKEMIPRNIIRRGRVIEIIILDLFICARNDLERVRG